MDRGSGGQVTSRAHGHHAVRAAGGYSAYSLVVTDRPGLRADRDFVRFWTARQISVMGSLITAVALPVLIYRLTHSATLTAMTTMLEGLPYLMFGLFAGALSDRWDRRRVMVAADLVCGTTIASIPIAHATGHLAIAHVLVSAFLSQALVVFFDGAAFGALPVLVVRERIGAANAALWGFGGVLDLGVPIMVGLLLGFVHPADLLAVDSVTFFVSALLIGSIGRPLTGDRDHVPPFAPRQLVAEVLEGVRYLWQHPGIRPMTLIGILQSISGAGFMALAVPYADRLLHIGTSGWRFGLLFASWGVGGILAAALTTRLLEKRTAVWLSLIGLPVSAVAGLVVALTGSWLVAVLAMTLWGTTYQAVIMNSITYRQQVTPEHLLGRVVTAGRMLAFGIGWTLGAAVAGTLAADLGVRKAMVTLVSVGAVAAAYAWWSPLRGQRHTAPEIAEPSATRPGGGVSRAPQSP